MYKLFYLYIYINLRIWLSYNLKCNKSIYEITVSSLHIVGMIDSKIIIRTNSKIYIYNNLWPYYIYLNVNYADIYLKLMVAEFAYNLVLKLNNYIIMYH